MSRTFISDMLSVRGMGVAVSVRQSTFAFSCLRRSLCFTPKRCSSSTTSRPRLRNATSFWIRRCVPIRMSTAPSAAAATTFFTSRGSRKRDSISMRTGKRAKRSLNVS